MQTARISDRYVIARENNVLRVIFDRRPDPPNPHFPGAGALRSACAYLVDAASRRPGSGTRGFSKNCWQITSTPRG
jgi:hypothetical protein